MTSWEKEKRRIKGAIFCQVEIIRPWMNGRPCKTSGNQKWQGAKPSLKARAIDSEIVLTSFVGQRIDHEPKNQAFIRALFKISAALIA